jgi:hypothetical protein
MQEKVLNFFSHDIDKFSTIINRVVNRKGIPLRTHIAKPEIKIGKDDEKVED